MVYRVMWGLVIVAGCASAEGQPEPPAPSERTAPAVSARRVEVATLERSSAHLDLRLPGEVEGARDAVLAAALGGYIERVAVNDGDAVRQGQVLVQVDAATHRARVSQARAELDGARRELERAQSLGDAIATAQRDAAETRHAAAVATHRAAQVQLTRSIVRAPFAGTVANLDIEVGEVAAPGAPLLRLIQLDTVKVTVSVSDRDVVALRPDMAAQVSTDAQSSAFEGRVSHINPAADPRTRAFTVEIAVDNSEHKLLPGMIAAVHIREQVGDQQLLVPQDWIVTHLDGLGVYIEEEGVARWRPVTLGRVARNQVVVESGIESGVRIVITGHRELADGDQLSVARTGTCCTNGRVVFD